MKFNINTKIYKKPKSLKDALTFPLSGKWEKMKNFYERSEKEYDENINYLRNKRKDNKKQNKKVNI